MAKGFRQTLVQSFALAGAALTFSSCGFLSPGPEPERRGPAFRLPPYASGFKDMVLRIAYEETPDTTSYHYAPGHEKICTEMETRKSCTPVKDFTAQQRADYDEMRKCLAPTSPYRPQPAEAYPCPIRNL